MRNIVFKNLPPIIGEYKLYKDEKGLVIISGATKPFKFVEFRLDPKRSKHDWKIKKFQNGELHLECIK